MAPGHRVVALGEAGGMPRLADPGQLPRYSCTPVIPEACPHGEGMVSIGQDLRGERHAVGYSVVSTNPLHLGVDAAG